MPACLRMSVNFTEMESVCFLADWVASDFRASSDQKAASSTSQTPPNFAACRGIIKCGPQARERFGGIAGGLQRKEAARWLPKLAAHWRALARCGWCRVLRSDCP